MREALEGQRGLVAWLYSDFSGISYPRRGDVDQLQHMPGGGGYLATSRNDRVEPVASPATSAVLPKAEVNSEH